MRIKVDYSEECKRTGKHIIPGEFAVYTKSGLFKPWVQAATYADYNVACIAAKRVRLEHSICPKYF